MTQSQWDLLAATGPATAAAAAVAACYWRPSLIAPFARLGQWADGRRLLCGLLLAFVPFAANACLALVRGLPRPVIHDEYGYLLAADTFAHGRLTNPPLPFPEHFEVPHVLVRPTYMSKYPPGQGIALAIGQVTAGLPIVGVWLSTAAAVAAAYWMLLAFVDGGWAAAGAVVLLVSPLVIRWGGNYWGGSVALLGGGLFVGGWARLLSGSPSGPRSTGARAVTSVGATLALAAGLVVLANSRPFEGLVFVALPLVAAGLRVRPSWRLAPAAALLAAAAAAMLYDDARVTGHPLRLPIAEYARQYDHYPKFWFLPTSPEHAYGNPGQRWVHLVFESGDYARLRTVGGFARIAVERLWQLASTHARPDVLWLPLVAGFTLVRRDRRLAWVTAALATVLAGLWAEGFFLPHYAAPATAGFLVLTVCGWRRLGRPWAAGVGVGLAAWVAVLAVAPPDPPPISTPQTLVAAAADLQVGRHVVFVRYAPDHGPDNEWVYNSADLTAQPVLFAHYLGPAADAPVAAAFGGGRRTWLLDVGKEQVSLKAYPLPPPPP